MIVSHKHKFIFVKTAKTAGTSIEIALSKHCGPDDVITPIVPEDEKIRTRLGYRGPQNYLMPLLKCGIRDLVRQLLRRRRRKRFFNHMPARHIKERIGDEVWSRYFTFCFERNPWDRAVSDYYWTYKSEPRPTIMEYLIERGPTLKRWGYDAYIIDGKVAVDEVCRFESLPEELEAIRKRVGIPESLNLPRAKSGFRKDKRHYREILTDEERGKIAELYRDEISLFGYTY